VGSLDYTLGTSLKITQKKRNTVTQRLQKNLSQIELIENTELNFAISIIESLKREEQLFFLLKISINLGN
jgi:hypothetical protein